MDMSKNNNDQLFQKIIANPDKGITYDEAIELLQISNSNIFDLFSLANRVRAKSMGDGVSLCSIVNAKSGYCPEDCKFCAQSNHHDAEIKKYPMLSAEEMLAAACDVEGNGAQHFGIVTSGHTLSKNDFETVLEAVKSIRKKTKLKVCASLGILSQKQLNQLKAAGLYKYHHNLETGESYFNQICTTHSYQERVAMVKHVKSAGLKVCSGGIIGLGETPEQRIELAETLRKLDVDSIPINILVPIPGTKLTDQKRLEPMEILKAIAIFRLMLPNKVIKLAGGREKNLRDLQALALSSGANGLLIGDYLTMPGQPPKKDLEMIKDLGLKPGIVEK